MIDDKNEIKKESEISKNKEKILDSESMILETQKRVWGALKKRL